MPTLRKYESLITILDKLCDEAPVAAVRFHPSLFDKDGVDQARSQAFIHLFLKVRFGLLSFDDRQAFVTDGSQDGGIDAYFIDRDAKKIYFVQSKFRTTPENFDSKNIGPEELLRMDVDRVTSGHTADLAGMPYNGKVQQLIRQIQRIEDMARWKIMIVLLANVKPTPTEKLRRLLGDFPVEEFDYLRSYNELVFPVVSGTYYNSADLCIDIDLHKKELAQSRIQYAVDTEYTACEITLLFVPTVEIAKVLHKYKNSILKYNPRSYLSLSTNAVNRDIADTINRKANNEFALFNNGITMLSEDTSFSERTGRPYRGQLHVRNPQVINGGQTAYTLSDIYSQAVIRGNVDQVFADKEVMLKVITLVDGAVDDDRQLKLIEAVSKATNQQTSVVEADRRSNESVQIELQRNIFETFGYFYERKKGEFYDGLKNRYIDKNVVIDREIFLRVAYAVAGSPEGGRRSSTKVLFSKQTFDQVLNDSSKYKSLFFGYRCYQHLDGMQAKFKRDPDKQNRFGGRVYGSALRYGKLAVVYVSSRQLDVDLNGENVDLTARSVVDKTLSKWLEFEEFARRQPRNHDYFRKRSDVATGEETVEADFDSYYKVQNLRVDLDVFFKLE